MGNRLGGGRSTWIGLTAFRRALHCGAAVAALGPGATFAQQGAEEAEPAEDVIVVTATRRAADIREVAASVDVIGGGALDRQSASGFQDYLSLAPSVQFNDTGASQAANITIRGVSTGATTGITQQTVGIYINETPFTDVFSFLSSPDLSPFDLERVEILRGPQGALYGSGSMGGAIRYITARPELGEYGAKYNGLVSFTENGGANTLNQGMINIPVGDDFALRGVVSYRTDDGFVDNLLTGEQNADDLEQIHARVSALWQPTDKLSVYANYIYQKSESDGFSTIDDPTGERLENASLPPPLLDLEYQIASLEAEYDFGFADWFVSGSYAKKDRVANSDQGPTGTTTTLAGFDFGLTQALGGIGAYTPGALLGFDIDQSLLLSQPTSDSYFAETRLTSKSDQPFRWMIGGLYTRIDNFNPIQQFIPGLNDALSTFTIPAPFDGIFGAPDAAGLFGVPENDQLLDFFQRSEMREYAVYGEIQYDLTDRLEITAGGRYFDFSVDTQLGLGGGVLADIDNDVNEFQPRVTVGYEAADNVYAYFIFSRGYRVGGVNDTVALTLAPGETLADSVAPLTYDTDSLFNYEGGVKSTWFDGDLTLDLGVYYIDWSDIQLSSFFPAPLSPSGGVAAISNVGAASILGFEGQLIAEINEHIRFTSSVSFNDAELDDDSPEVPNLETGMLAFAPAGTQLPGSRRWQTSNAITLTGDIGRVPVALTATHQYAGATLNDFTVQAPLEAYNLVDVRLDLDVEEGVRVGLFVDNVGDVREAVQVQPANPGFAPRQFVVTRPRTIGVNVSASF